MRGFYSASLIGAVCLGGALLYEGTDWLVDRDETLDRVNSEPVLVEPATQDVILPLSGAVSVPSVVSGPVAAMPSSAPQVREFARNDGGSASEAPISIGPYKDPDDPTSINSGEVIIIGEYKDPEPEGNW